MFERTKIHRKITETFIYRNILSILKYVLFSFKNLIKSKDLIFFVLFLKRTLEYVFIQEGPIV